MPAEKKHLARELKTITVMTEMYCFAHHNDSRDGLCDECADFMDYIAIRLEKCPYGEEKPTCDACPIHCYKKERRVQGTIIMRYSGPRMLLRHPLLTIAHKIDGLRKVRHPRELEREQRFEARGKR